MRFACPYCHTKYQIPAEKMAGGLVRVKCKNCSKVIAVRSPQTADSGNRAANPVNNPDVLADNHWHYVAGEERVGPRPRQELVEAIQSGAVTSESFAWKPGMASWEKVGDIDELAKFIPVEPEAVAPPPLTAEPAPDASAKAKASRSSGPGSRPKPRSGRFGRATSITRGGGPLGAPKSRVVAPTRRFAGTPGAKGAEGDESGDLSSQQAYLREPGEEQAQLDEVATPQNIAHEAEVSVPDEMQTGIQAADPAEEEFAATLQDSGAIHAFADELEEKPEGEQLSLLSDGIELPDATKAKRELASEPTPETDTEKAEESVEEPGVEALIEQPAEEAEPEQTEETPEEAEPEQTEETAEEAEPEQTEETAEEAEPEQTEETPEEAELEQTEEPAEEAEPEQTEEPPEEAELEQTEEPAEEAEPEQSEDLEEEAEPEQSEDLEEELPGDSEDDLILEGDAPVESSLDLDDPSNPETAGPTLPFHLDEESRTSLDELFSPLDSKPTSSESIIVPFAAPDKQEDETEDLGPLQIPGQEGVSSREESELPVDESIDQEDDNETSTEPEEESVEQDALEEAPTMLDGVLPGTIDSREDPVEIPQLPAEATVTLEEDGDDSEVLESDFFSMDDEEADESSVNFEFSPPELPTKEEIQEGKDELKRLLSEDTSKDAKESKEVQTDEARKAREEIRKLGMEAPSTPSGKRLTLIAAGIIGLLVLVISVLPEKEEPKTFPEKKETVEKESNPGKISRPTYAPPPEPEPAVEEAKVEEAGEVEAEPAEQESETPSWKANFDTTPEEVKQKNTGTTPTAETEKQVVKSGESAAPLDNRALAGLMGKDDGADLRGLKENTKKALSDMRTATEVSSDVLNKLFLKKSPQIKRCATRHNLSGKVVVKFTVKTNGETANTQVDTTPAPPTSDGIECIEKIVSGWKFPAQDQESVFSKILVF